MSVIRFRSSNYRLITRFCILDRMAATTKSNGALTYVYLLVYIVLSSGQIFFNKEGGAFYYKNDSDEPTASIVPCHEKYISKSYFKEHERLQDSSFQDYIVRVLEGNPERVYAELLDLHHNLVGEGSHRHLSSYLRYSIEPDSISDPSGQQCEIILIERLPSGVFADPFEYQHLIQRGVFKDAVVFGDTNLELPSFLSSRSMVKVHIEVDSNITSGQKFSREVKVELPVHARYPVVLILGRMLFHGAYLQGWKLMPKLYLQSLLLQRYCLRP